MSQNYLLFEEAGQFKTGTILQDTGTSLQVELTTGKRVKVKQANVMLRFASPGPAEMLAEALQEAENIDIDFLWEVAPQEEFDYQLLVAEYYGENPSVVQQTAMLMRLHGMPVYFYRKGRGRYRPAQPDTLKAALAASTPAPDMPAALPTTATVPNVPLWLSSARGLIKRGKRKRAVCCHCANCWDKSAISNLMLFN